MIVGFASLLLGTVTVIAGITGSSFASVVRGAPDRSKATGPATPVEGTAAAEQTPSAAATASSGSGGFTVGAGTNYTFGKEPEIAKRLGEMATSLGVHLTGISGYRSPEHSVSVGGFSDDPHTRGEASDTEGTASLSKAILNKFGLERPFPEAKEADHIQLLHSVTTFGGY